MKKQNKQQQPVAVFSGGSGEYLFYTQSNEK